jgi:predicted CXXCH cytochrome family protein
VVGVYDADFAYPPLGTLNPAPLTLTSPNDMALDPVYNELYVVDSGANRVLVFREAHCSVTIPQACGGSASCPDGETCVSLGSWKLASESGQCSTTLAQECGRPADPPCPVGETCLRRTGSWGVMGSGLGEFISPQAIAVDATINLGCTAEGEPWPCCTDLDTGTCARLLVTDVDNFRVQAFSREGMVDLKFGYRILYTTTSSTAWFARSEGIALDECGNIYITDALMGTVRVFDPDGKELGTTHTPAVQYGTGTNQLRVPCDVMINDAGKLFVASTNNAEVAAFDVACTEGGGVAAARAAADSIPSVEGPLSLGNISGLNGLWRKIRARLPSFPDNPAEIVAAMQTVEYREDLDANLDRRVNRLDLEMAVADFGAATVEDFLNPNTSVAEQEHPAINVPHILDIRNRCGRCHSMDAAPGGMLTAAGQENLCQSCHSAGKIAGSIPIAAGDTEMNHPWGVPASNADPGPAAGSDVAGHLNNGNVRCGTCHNPHERYESVCQIPTEGVPTPGTHIGRCMGGPFNGKLCQSNDQCTNPYLRTDGDRIELCGECHKEYAEWLHAGHAEHDAGAFNRDWTTSGRTRCRRCHSGDGYVDFNEGVPWTAGQRRGTHRVVDCLVCHATHGASQDEKLLRVYGSVTIFETTGNPAGMTLGGLGESATCVACHNGRDPVTDTGLTPHYFLGGAMLLGFNGVSTFRGITYDVDVSEHTNLLNDGDLGCASCHMAPSPEPGEPGAGKVGGHTFNLAVHDMDDPDFGFENVVNACNGCHDPDLTVLNTTAGGDYDGDGEIEGVQDETEGLMDLLQAAIEATGAVKLPSNPYWRIAQCVGGTNAGATCTSNSTCTGGGTCVTIITTMHCSGGSNNWGACTTNDDCPDGGTCVSDRPIVEDAIWNWEFVDNSGDRGVKNTGYAIGLLQIAYLGVTNTPVPGAEYRYTAP